MYKHLGILGRRFAWAGGIEDTFIPQERSGLRALDEYELTQHYTQWRGDLERASQAGIRILRWGVPWYKVEPCKGQFDWSFTDEVLNYMVNDLGITPIIDLVHYGTPLWLEGSFVDAEYSDCVADYAKAFASRYGNLVRYYTPLNEPTVNAEFSGLKGEWPPYLRDSEGYVEVLLPISLGIQKTVRAIKSVDDDAIFVAVEAMHLGIAVSQGAENAAREVFYQDLLCYDLVRGMVTAKHPMHAWLIQKGVSPAVLAELVAGAVHQHVLGVNFYPWSGTRLDVDKDGRLVNVGNNVVGAQLLDVLRLVHDYVDTPLMVTETSNAGEMAGRKRWMRETIAAVAQARREKIPVLGFTWFPIFTMIGWEYRTATTAIDKHLLHLGLWDCEFDEDAVLVRRHTPMVDLYSRFIRRGSPRARGKNCKPLC